MNLKRHRVCRRPAVLNSTSYRTVHRCARLPCLLAMFTSMAASRSSAQAHEELRTLPAVNETVVIDDVRVTLLDARRLSADEYRVSGGNLPDAWAGGGVHLAFFVENRPGQPIPPVMGEIRVLFDSRLYNAVTNAISVKPFAPFLIVRELKDFYATAYGRAIGNPPESRPRLTSGVLEYFVRGGSIPSEASGVVELEQGSTRLPESPLRRQLSAADVVYHWFRFRLPALD